MRFRLLLALSVMLSLTGCFPRMAHYDDDGGSDQAVVKPHLDGPTANVPRDRIVSFITLNNPLLNKGLVDREADAILREAGKQGVPANLLVSLIATESDFDPHAVSPAGAQGLGQLLPDTAREVGVKDPFDPEDNIAGTAKYIAWLGGYWAKHPRRWELALASYLAGVGTVGNQLKAGRDLTAEQSAYVRKILQLSTRV